MNLIVLIQFVIQRNTLLPSSIDVASAGEGREYARTKIRSLLSTDKFNYFLVRDWDGSWTFVTFVNEY